MKCPKCHCLFNVDPYRSIDEIPIDDPKPEQKPSKLKKIYTAFVQRYRYFYLFGSIVNMITYCTILGYVVLIGFVSYKCFMSSNQISFCYLNEYDQNTITLMGNKEYRPDEVIGYFSSIAEAKKAADKLNCEMR